MPVATQLWMKFNWVNHVAEIMVSGQLSNFLKSLKKTRYTHSPFLQLVSNFQYIALSPLIRVIRKVTLCLTRIPSAFAHYPLFQRYLQSKEILLNLGMKCRNSAFNAQGSRIVIVLVQVGGVKLYVVEALRKKERQDQTQLTTKIGAKTRLGPSYFLS